MRPSTNRLWSDLRIAARKLRREPFFTAIVVGFLGLGMGVYLVIFSLVESILLRPLPYPDPETLVQVWEHDLFNDDDRSLATTANFLDWRRRSELFEDFGFFMSGSGNLRGGEEPTRLQEGIISTNYFDVLGVRPHRGRFFVPEEAELGNFRVAVISYDLWQRWFGGDPGVIDQFMNLEGARYKVVGVLPQGFRYPHPGAGFEPDLWRPLPIHYYRENRADHFLEVVGRVKSGVSLAAAQEEMDSICRRLSEEFPETNAHRGASLVPLRQHVTGELRQPLLLLLGAVGLLLVITCSNVGMLMLSRAEARQGEVAVRTALGAESWSLLRPMTLESLLLAVAGALIAWAFAPLALRRVLEADTWQLARMDEIGFHLPAVGITLALVLITVVVCGLGPAVVALGRRDLYSTLRQGGRSGTSGLRVARWQQGLVVVEVALAILLLFGAGLLARSYLGLLRVDPGFDTENALTASLLLSWKEYEEPVQRAQFFERLIERLEGLESVRSAAAISLLPLQPRRYPVPFTVEGQMMGSGEAPLTELRQASRGYFATAGVSLLEGRPFTREDHADSMPVAIVNRHLAERYWPGTSAVGQRIRLGQEDSEQPWRTVVGVSRDVHQARLDEPPGSQVYLPMTQAPQWEMQLVLRTAGSPWSLVQPLRQAVIEMDATQVPFAYETLEQIYRGAMARERLFLLGLGLFAAAALILAALGMYSIMAYHVHRREHEIGLRMAIGARRPDVVRLILRRGMALFTIGGVAGLLLALSVGRLTGSLLYRISASDPWTLVMISGLTALVALFACIVPARQAAAIEPIDALRRE